MRHFSFLFFFLVASFLQAQDTQTTYDAASGTLTIVKCADNATIVAGKTVGCDEQAYCITDTKRVWLDADSYSSSPGARWTSPSQIRGAYPHHSWTVELWETEPISQVSYTIWADGYNEQTNQPVSIWLKCRKTREDTKNIHELIEAHVMQE